MLTQRFYDSFSFDNIHQSMFNPWLADKGWIGGSRVNDIGYRRREVV